MLRRLLASRWILLWAALLGVLLTAPSLFGGLQTEDHVFRAVATSQQFSLSHVNLWGPALPPSPAARRHEYYRQRDLGMLPWITDKDFQVSFWRPLGSLTHQLDFHLWPDSPMAMHAQNLLWYALLIAAVALLYRRFFDPLWIAGLACVVYAVDDAHGQAVGWIANRSALVAALFAVLALYFQDRHRRDGWKPGALLAALSLGAGLLGSEMALCGVGYLVAHALVVDRDRPVRRLRAALPWMSVLAGWAVLYRALGHGVRGSGLYLDPLRQPLAFLMQAPARILVLLLAQFGAPPSDLWNALPFGRPAWGAVLALVVLGVMLWLLVPWLARDRSARFWALGMLLSLIPAAGTFPEDRLLVLAGVGGSAIIARVVAVFGGASVEHGRRGTRVLAGAWAGLSLLVAPLLLPLRCLTMQRYEARLAVAKESAFSLVHPPARQLVLLDAPDYYFSTMMLLTRMAVPDPIPEHTLCVAGTLHGVRVRRVDPNAIEVRPERGFLARPLDRLYRSRTARMHKGEAFLAGGAFITITDVDRRGAPLAALFRFDWSLENPHLVFLAWKSGHYARIRLPRVGHSILLGAR